MAGGDGVGGGERGLLLLLLRLWWWGEWIWKGGREAGEESEEEGGGGSGGEWDVHRLRGWTVVTSRLLLVSGVEELERSRWIVEGSFPRDFHTRAG